MSIHDAVLEFATNNKGYGGLPKSENMDQIQVNYVEHMLLSIK